jgi:hypothetical protein
MQLAATLQPAVALRPAAEKRPAASAMRPAGPGVPRPAARRRAEGTSRPPVGPALRHQRTPQRHRPPRLLDCRDRPCRRRALQRRRRCRHRRWQRGPSRRPGGSSTRGPGPTVAGRRTVYWDAARACLARLPAPRGRTARASPAISGEARNKATGGVSGRGAHTSGERARLALPRRRSLASPRPARPECAPVRPEWPPGGQSALSPDMLESAGEAPAISPAI